MHMKNGCCNLPKSQFIQQGMDRTCRHKLQSSGTKGTHLYQCTARWISKVCFLMNFAQLTWTVAVVSGSCKAARPSCSPALLCIPQRQNISWPFFEPFHSFCNAQQRCTLIFFWIFPSVYGEIPINAISIWVTVLQTTCSPVGSPRCQDEAAHPPPVLHHPLRWKPGQRLVAALQLGWRWPWWHASCLWQARVRHSQVCACCFPPTSSLCPRWMGTDVAARQSLARCSTEERPCGAAETRCSSSQESAFLRPLSARAPAK